MLSTAANDHWQTPMVNVDADLTGKATHTKVSSLLGTSWKGRGLLAKLYWTVCLAALAPMAFAKPAPASPWLVIVNQPSCSVSKQVGPGAFVVIRWPGRGQSADLYLPGMGKQVEWVLPTGKQFQIKVASDGLSDADPSEVDLEKYALVNGQRVTFGDDFDTALGKCEDMPFVQH